MVDNLEFNTAKKRRDPITFTLDGEEYTFNPPKSAFMMLPLMLGQGDDTLAVKQMFDWLDKGLPKPQVQKLIRRLKDDKDDFDVDDLDALVAKLMETVSGRPTT